MKHATFLIVTAALPFLSFAAAPATPWQRPTDWDKTAANVESLEKYRCPKPAEFVSVFSFGFADDHMPADPARFEALLVKLQAAGFTVVHTAYRPDRPAACGRHGMKLMIDFLFSGHLVYKTPAACQEVCRKVEGDPNVWGYDVWNQGIYSETVGKGRRRDVNNVRRWDPSHPTYVGTWGDKGLDYLPNADVFGYYDLAWGKPEVLEKHFVHLTAALAHARKIDAYFYSWLGVPSGAPGEENFRRCLWSANTGIACGLKGMMWFLGTNMMDEKTLEWRPAGLDIPRINKRIMPMKTELLKIGNPHALYSTPVTKTPDDAPLPNGQPSRMPQGLETHAFPKDFWAQPAAGEFLAGFFKDDAGRDVAYLANHNARLAQKVALKLSRAGAVHAFDCKSGQWVSLTLDAGTLRLDLEPGGGQLLRFEK